MRTNVILIRGSYNDNIDRLFSPGYLPNDIDILLSYTSTSGIQETPLRLNGKKYHVFDCGGGRHPRMNWNFLGSGILRTMVYCASLSSYDQCLSQADDDEVCVSQQ